MDNTNRLTPEERTAINALGDRLYTADFVEEWINMKAEPVEVNAPIALQKMGAVGFLRAVRLMLRKEVA